MSLAARILAGDRLALAQLLTKLERGEHDGHRVLAELYPHTGRAHIIGVTGAPGTGKSTLVNELVLGWRSPGENASAQPRPTVAIVAVDPTSPFTGGAILGDRIRMRDLSGDPGVFIRSMATRGALGGVARATHTLVVALDAAGFDIVVIETVGAGQSEVEVAGTAHTTLVVEAPGLGDGVQALKAGILEIGDILVLNKADLAGADDALRTLRMAVEMGAPPRQKVRTPQQAESRAEWTPLIVSTVATRAEGVPELLEAVKAHRDFLQSSGQLQSRERERVSHLMEALVRERLFDLFLQGQPDGRWEAALARVLSREVAPWQAVDELLAPGQI